MRISKSIIAVPPGATIKEQLEYRKMKQKEFALRMDMSEKHISKLINGEVQLTFDVAMRLEMVLGVPAKFWNNLEAIYQEKLVRVKAENAMDQDIEIAKKFSYAQMAKNKWVEETRNAKEKVINLRKFFEVAELSLLKKENLIPKISCAKPSFEKEEDYDLMAWAQKAKLDARVIETKALNLKKLEEAIMKIRTMTRHNPSEFSGELSKLLADCGIALVYLPHIARSFLHGGTFWDRRKIVLGLTTRGKDADKFWFSLFHELGHIQLGHINSKSCMDNNYEKEADEFAKEILIPKKDFDNFVKNNVFNKRSILEFADLIEIDPGIIVGRLQKEGYIDFSNHNDLKRKYTIS